MNKVALYDAYTGNLLKTNGLHEGTVFCSDWQADGKAFVTGAADSIAILWTPKCKGIVRLRHGHSVQSVSFNPKNNLLLSCTEGDFGLWNTVTKKAIKVAMPNRILSSSWCSDGRLFALGMESGEIRLHRRNADHLRSLSEVGGSPVWSLAWSPAREGEEDLLCAGTWDGTLSFYTVGGHMVVERAVQHDPCTVSWSPSGQYVLAGGSNKKAALYTRKGVHLADVAERNDWVWSAKMSPVDNLVAVGTNDGKLTVHKIDYGKVHSLYGNRYVFRRDMENVVVQHLLTSSRSVLRMENYVQNVSIYNGTLAVQLPDRIVIYSLDNPASPDQDDIKFKRSSVINASPEADIMVVTAEHVTLCKDRKLQCLDWSGMPVREWVLESSVRYVKAAGGPSGREALLVGLASGAVLKIFVDNPFPIPLIRQAAPVHCLDISANRRKLAIVDDARLCCVYDLETREMLYKESGALSVAWNAELDDMLCFSHDGVLSIKTGNFPVHTQMVPGFVVGFSGSSIFCLHNARMQTVDVPQGASLYRYLEARDFAMAYNVACLGVTDADWRLLALEALRSMDLDIARQAFIRVRDMRFIYLINDIEKRRNKLIEEAAAAGNKLSKATDQMFLAEVLAYQGAYAEAARTFVQAGAVDKAVKLYSDLRMWDKAKEVAKAGEKQGKAIDVAALSLQQAAVAEETGDWGAARDMYMASGEHAKAVELMCQRNDVEGLLQCARSLPETEKKLLSQCGRTLRRANMLAGARECFEKAGDIDMVMRLHVDTRDWPRAFQLAKEHEGRFSKDIFLPYAQHLAASARYVEAVKAFREADHPEAGAKLLAKLAHNSVVMNRFSDAAHAFDWLSREHMGMVSAAPGKASAVDQEHMRKAFHFRHMADVYAAYHPVQQYVDQPFTAESPEVLFHAACFVINAAPTRVYGVSRVRVLFALAKYARKLKAYKAARFALERIQRLRLPSMWRDQMDLAALTVQSKPFTDREDLLAVCFRCNTSNPLMNTSPRPGDVCVTCGHPFVRSPLVYEALPLVEFVPERGVSDEVAFAMCQQIPTGAGSAADGRDADGWREGERGDAQTLSLGGGGEEKQASESGDALFQRLLSNFSPAMDAPYEPLVCPEEIIRAMDPRDLIVLKWPSKGMAWQFFRVMIPGFSMTTCENCWRVFPTEILEFYVLEHGECPVCRSKDVYGKDTAQT